MIRAPRVPRPSRPILLTILVTALLAFPFGIVLASHQFSDVPNTNPFHADIDALVDSGVTSGCGGGKYCPASNVTREQMAAFLNRLGALAPGKTPVVNADKVDGLHASGLTRLSRAGASGADVSVTGTSAAPQIVTSGTATIQAPAAGFVQVTAVINFVNYATACTGLDCNGFLQVRHLQSGDVGLYTTAAVSPTESSVEVAAVTWIFPVSAGTNQFQMEVYKNPGASAGIQYFHPQITALYGPFGSTGVGTLSLDDPAVQAPEPGSAGTK